MHHSVALVVFMRQTWQIRCPTEILFDHGDVESYAPNRKESSAIDFVAADVRSSFVT